MNSKPPSCANDVLDTDGLLSQIIPDFTPRLAQLKMAQEIEKAIQQQLQLIVEAGTGIGKTFGYLVPIFLAQQKSIISTGTKNLQDQLFFKDVPIIKKIFSQNKKVVLLKGRANYLCRYRLKYFLEEGHFTSRHEIAQLQAVHDWQSHTLTGDIAEITTVSEDAPIWRLATSTADNCLGQECEFYKNCFVIKARQQALAADIVIVNHHLFFADMALQEQGTAELLPNAEIIVFDEAHQVPEIASQFFSTSFSSRQVVELAKDTEIEAFKETKDMKFIFERAGQLEKTIRNLRDSLGPALRRAPWPDIALPLLNPAIDEVKAALKALEAILKEAAPRSKGLENCWHRSLQLIELFNLVTGSPPDNKIHWFETYPQSFVLHLTPMTIAQPFQALLKETNKTWLFTSATLTVKNSFRLFIDSLGLETARHLQLPSPFDYQQQTILYVPRGLPDTHAKHYIEAMIEAILPVLQHAGGRTFILFTSHKAMEQAAEVLKDCIHFPLLVQGTLPKRSLVEEFKILGNAVLLGTHSFWHGVDVRGETLSCVIIDKLPFGAPEDPILKARARELRRQGVDPFLTYQLPQAVLALKQGAGRLIRDCQDRGILVICDPRLVGARYGGTFLQSLPNMPRTRELSKVQEFVLL